MSALAPTPTRVKLPSCRLPGTEPLRCQGTAPLTPQQVLARYQPGKADPLQVLDVLIALHNTQHTAREKTVSHKTRSERARFLRQFFRELRTKGGFATMPDPRNLAHRHLQAMVDVWQREHMAPATLQTYLSFLRGLAGWLDKPGLVRKPQHYGLRPEAYQRREIAQCDKSWKAHGLDPEAVIAQIAGFDARIGACLRLMHTLALRRKESLMFRPSEHVLPFAQTGLPAALRKADDYVWIKGKGGRVRWVAVETDVQRHAIALARAQVSSPDGHLGDPARDLKRNLRRLDYVLEKFGITRRQAGATSHGLRHGNLHGVYENVAGVPSPVRGGGAVSKALDRAARQAVSERAGHARARAAAPYIGSARRAAAPSGRGADRDLR
jgi:site-specific recombinase XerC